jgi:MATE family multidrug resistance protein
MRLTDIRPELPPLLRLAAPLIAGELGWMSMSVVDTTMVGRL